MDGLTIEEDFRKAGGSKFGETTERRRMTLIDIAYDTEKWRGSWSRYLWLKEAG